MPKSILSLVLFVSTCVPAAALTLTDTTIANVTGGTGLAVASDGRVFILQQTGQIRIVENGILSTPALDIPSFDSAFSLGFASEHGLIGIALDPNFATNQYLYVQYTANVSGGIGNRIARFTMNGSTSIDPNSMQVLLDTDANGNNGHVGGGLAFGADGKLYTTIGDRRVPASSQNPADTFGSVLRLNPDGTFAGGNVIPTDNPLCTNQAQKNCAIYVQGLRNPFAISVQAGTGLMFINDAGENTWEEINAVAGTGVTPPAGNSGGPGANFGWDNCEGPCIPTQPGKTDPLYYYSSASGSGNCAITAGTFYNPANPNLPGNFVGDYLFIDYCKGQLTALDFSGGTITTEILHQLPNFGTIALAVAPNGGIYYLSRNDNPGSANNRLGLLFNNSVPEPKTWIMLSLALSLIYAKVRTRRA